MAKASQRQIVASIAPKAVLDHETGPTFTGYFAQISGGEITSAAEKIYTGGTNFPETLCAPAEIGDITLTRHFDPKESGTPLKTLRQMVGRAYYDITVVTFDCDIKVLGTERSYVNCLLVGLTEPEGDASSGAPATYALTFTVQGISA